MSNDQYDLVHIGWAYGAADVALVRAAFAGAGIPIFTSGGYVHQMMPHQAIAMGGIQINVLARDHDAASHFLNSCRRPQTHGFGWRFSSFVVVLSLLFGPMPMPFNAIYMRDRASAIVAKA